MSVGSTVIGRLGLRLYVFRMGGFRLGDAVDASCFYCNIVTVSSFGFLVVLLCARGVGLCREF